MKPKKPNNNQFNEITQYSGIIENIIFNKFYNEFKRNYINPPITPSQQPEIFELIFILPLSLN